MFEHIITIERHPDGDNQRYPLREAGDVYDAERFNKAVCAVRIGHYEQERDEEQ